MKVLVVSVDVTNLSQSEIDDLQTSMEVQVEDFDAEVINSGTRDLDSDDIKNYIEEEDEDGYTH